MRDRRLLFLLLLTAAVVSGCRDGQDLASPGKLTVAVTVAPHAWLVKQIGGEHVDVLTMVNPGESAEVYQPTDAQISRLAKASAYFRVGMPLERSRGLAAIQSEKGMRVEDLRKGIQLHEMVRHSHHDEHGENAHEEHGHDSSDSTANDSLAGKDPHIWLSARLLKVQAQTVADTLAEIDPANKEDYARNLAFLLTSLDQLDKQIGQILAPYRGKAFFVFHPAWAYFADDYGLRQVAVETEGKEPSDRELTELQRQARQEGIKVIFVQRQTAGQSARVIADTIGGRTEILDDLSADLSASLLNTAKLLAESFR